MLLNFLALFHLRLETDSFRSHSSTHQGLDFPYHVLDISQRLILALHEHLQLFLLLFFNHLGLSLTIAPQLRSYPFVLEVTTGMLGRRLGVVGLQCQVGTRRRKAGNVGLLKVGGGYVIDWGKVLVIAHLLQQGVRGAVEHEFPCLGEDVVADPAAACPTTLLTLHILFFIRCQQ